MDLFEWFDARTSTRWKVTVLRWGPDGSPAPTGRVIVRFEAYGRSYELSSPLHPEPQDEGILSDLLDIAREQSGDPAPEL